MNIRPNARLTSNVGYIFAKLDGRFEYSEETLGTGFTGAPLDTFFAGEGEVDRTTNLLDVDIVYDVADTASIVGGARFRRFDQEAHLRCAIGPCEESELEQGESVDTAADISTDIFEVGLRVFPNPKYQITGGLRLEQRDVTVLHEGELEEEPSTDRTTFFLNGVVQPSPKLNIMAEYERGSYDEPFTLISPESLDRVKVRVRIFPLDGLTITGVVHTQRVDNEIVEGVTISPGELSYDNYTGHAHYAVERLRVYGGFTRQKWSSEITNLITTLPGPE